MPNIARGKFAWDAAKNSDREDQLVSAVLQLCTITRLQARQLEASSRKITETDIDEAVAETVDWAAVMFPDLNVRRS